MLVDPGTVVMVVDDDSLVRHSVAAVLGMEGYEALPVSSGEAALAQITAGVRPSVVILDLWLPGIGSVEFTRRLQAKLPTRVPVLVLSGWPSWKKLEFHADAVLAKPAEATAIVRAVDKLASSRAAPVGQAPARLRRPSRKAPRPETVRIRQARQR